MSADSYDGTQALESTRSEDGGTLNHFTSFRPDVDAMAMCDAAGAGNLTALTALLDAGKPHSWLSLAWGDSGSPSVSSPPLLAACRGGHVACAALLIDRGADASAPGPGSCGVTPAWRCLEGDKAACLGLLLERGARFGPLEGGGFIAAAAHGAVACMEELLRRGADPRAEGLRDRHGAAAVPDKFRSPLHAACSGGHAAAVACLCRHGAVVDVTDEGGGTPLLLACKRGRRKCAEVLLLHGADPDAADDEGASPLLIALTGRDIDCASLLLDHGAAVMSSSQHDAAASPSDTERTSRCWWWKGVLDYSLSAAGDAPQNARACLGARLLAAGLPTELRDSDGDTPLLSAAAAGDALAARLLCAHGASVGAVRIHPQGGDLLASPEEEEEEGCTALDLAMRPWPGGPDHDFAVIDELIERGAAVIGEGGESSALLRGLEAMWSLGEGVAAGDALSRFHAAMLPSAVRRVALLIARWPLGAPLPACSVEEVAQLLPAALEHAQSRLEVLRGGSGDGEGQQQQQELAAAFLRHVRDACGGAVAPAYAPFAHFRFVAAGGLERASAWEREVHRFPLERVALCRAALQVATEAEAAAAERSLPLLRDATTRGAAQKQLYAAACAAGRWGVIIEAVNSATQGVRSAEATLGAAVIEAEAALQRLTTAGGAVTTPANAAGAGGVEQQGI